MAEAALIRLENQPWLDRTSETVQSAVSKAFDAIGPAAPAVKDLLHGTWMGHPLHPALTDVPVGAWTSALVLDAVEEITGNRACGEAARAAIGIGLVGAIGAAVTGIADWQATGGKARNLGFAHGLLNVAATALYATSYAMRGNNGRKKAGRGLSWAGFAVAMASAHIGGHLVFRNRLGVDHAQRGEFPSGFTPVLPAAGLSEGQMKRVDTGEGRVLLARCEGEVHAISEVCSHLGGPLAEGKLNGCEVECPWHGSVFSVKDGSVVHGPAAHPAARLEAREQNGQIEVRLRGAQD